MSETHVGMPVQERMRAPEGFSLEGEYARSFQTLNRAGILSILPDCEFVGVVDAEGKEYPAPRLAEVRRALFGDKEKDGEEKVKEKQAFIEEKMRQGFTRLQLTPLAMPLSTLADRAGGIIRKHAEQGNIFQAKRNPDDPDTPVRVNTDEPIWMWDKLVPSEQNGELVYFPKSFTQQNHRGLTKAEAIADPTICAVPGWSVSLVEDTPFLPQQGQGETRGGRKQPETNHSPNDYLKTFTEPGYKGETGWTHEDFLTNFLTHLEETNQVSHDWDDYSASWLTGVYHAKDGVVPFARWDRIYGQVRVNGNTPDYRAGNWGASSTVRFSL